MSREGKSAVTSTANRFTALGANSSDRADCEVRVVGEVPHDLNGSLYRNGPGMFRRNNVTKDSLLDGDGIVQRLSLSGGRATYARRFVRTEKFEAESQAGRFIYPTWTTRAPQWFPAIGQHMQSQAGVTVYRINGKLCALDEGSSPGFQVDQQNLETLQPMVLGLPDDDAGMKAHARRIASSGDWIFASTRYGSKGMLIDLTRLKPDGSRVATPTVVAPTTTYLHDFGATENYAVFILQPVRFHMVRFLSGLVSFVDSLEWQPNEGNLVLLIDLASGETRQFEAPSAWVWHIGNMYEEKGEIILDFVGYDDPFHFLGSDSQLSAIMRGIEGQCGAPGTLRRYVVNGSRTKISQSILHDGSFEFPAIDWRNGGRNHDRLYFTHGKTAGIIHSAIASFDTKTGALDAFDFGSHITVGEPVLVSSQGNRPDQGWLIAQYLDIERDSSGFAILNASDLAAGPVATIDLEETVPISFHGCWVSSRTS